MYAFMIRSYPDRYDHGNILSSIKINKFAINALKTGIYKMAFTDPLTTLVISSTNIPIIETTM